jgi:hypothetical protein
MFYTAAERVQSPTEYTDQRSTERDPTPPYVRAYIGALNWLRGASGAQHGTGYRDVDPTLHEERAAELPRFLAVVSHERLLKFSNIVVLIKGIVNY